MRKLLLVIFSIFILFSCQNEKIDNNSEEFFDASKVNRKVGSGPLSRPAEKWHSRIEEGYPKVVTVNDSIVFVGASSNSMTLSFGAVVAFDREEGKKLWSQDTEYSVQNIEANEEMVLCGTEGGKAIAFDANSGVKKWSLSAEGSIVDIAIFDGSAYAASEDTYVYSANKSNGDQRWRYKNRGSVTGIAVNEKKVISTTEKGRIYALNRKTGSKVWSYNGGSSIHMPSIYKDYVISIENHEHGLSETVNDHTTDIIILNEDKGGIYKKIDNFRDIVSYSVIDDGLTVIFNKEGGFFSEKGAVSRVSMSSGEKKWEWLDPKERPANSIVGSQNSVYVVFNKLLQENEEASVNHIYKINNNGQVDYKYGLPTTFTDITITDDNLVFGAKNIGEITSDTGYFDQAEAEMFRNSDRLLFYMQ